MPRPTSDVQAFEAHAPDADLDDLRARLAAARLPEAETVYRAAPRLIARADHRGQRQSRGLQMLARRWLDGA